MGAWGSGIFENDIALDEFYDTFDELLFRLRSAVEDACPADTRVLAHMVALVGAGCSPHDSYTKANAIDWRNKALVSLLSERSEGDDRYILNCEAAIKSVFEAVIENASPSDSDADSDAFEFRYAKWIELQKQIGKIDRYEIYNRVVRARQHLVTDETYWDGLVESYENESLSEL